MFPICAQIEAEISDMDDEDKEMFLADLGLETSGLNRIIKEGYSLLWSYFIPDSRRTWVGGLSKGN